MAALALAPGLLARAIAAAISARATILVSFARVQSTSPVVILVPVCVPLCAFRIQHAAHSIGPVERAYQTSFARTRAELKNASLRNARNGRRLPRSELVHPNDEPFDWS